MTYGREFFKHIFTYQYITNSRYDLLYLLKFYVLHLQDSIHIFRFTYSKENQNFTATSSRE